MAIIQTIPKLMSTKLQMVLKTNLVGKQICTMETASEIKRKGDSVMFPGLSDPSVSPYTGTISTESLADASVTMLIDQQNYFSFYVDDIEAFRSVIDIKGTALDRAAYKLRDTADKYILGLYASAANTITATVSETIALSTTATVIRKLDEADVEGGQRWLVIPPWYKEKLELAGVKFSLLEGIAGAKSGISWVKHLDTDIYVSNNLTTTGAEGTYNTQCLAGSYNSIVYAEQILKTRIIEDVEASFSAQCSGYHVYGAKVIRPKELVRINATQASASATI